MSDERHRKVGQDLEPSSEPSIENGIGRNVVSLGWVAFFGGLAQDMIQPILPIF